MRSTALIFGASSAFFFIVAAVYWFVTYEVAGTLMLGLWCATFLFASAFLAVAAKRGAPPGDDPDRRPQEAAGDWVGAFRAGSSWPIVLAAGLAIGLAGLVYGAWLLIPGALVTIAALLGLMRESAAA
jgi:cytochrome c oxidase subunit IV